MKRSTLSRLLSGVIAGVASTTLMQAMQMAGMKWMPHRMPPIRQEPGEYMVEKAEQLLPQQGAEVPEQIEKALAKGLRFGYGTTFALLFAATRPRVKNLVVEGSALGLATWAAGYLGWLPATRPMAPVTKQKPEQVMGALSSHIIFGIAAVAIYRELRRRL